METVPHTLALSKTCEASIVIPAHNIVLLSGNPAVRVRLRERGATTSPVTDVEDLLPLVHRHPGTRDPPTCRLDTQQLYERQGGKRLHAKRPGGQADLPPAPN
jgi:hypothetical protein